MVTAMEAYLGTGEPNAIQRWYDAKFGAQGGLNWPWCDATVTKAAWDSGNQNAVTYGGGFSYTVAHAQAFKAHGDWHYDVAGIQRGDVVFFDWGLTDNIGSIDHVGLVTSVESDGVHTVEGNIDNVCARRVRSASEIVGFGRPQYAATPAPPVDPPKPPPVIPRYEPFPGVAFFKSSPNSPIITAMGRRLVEEGCSAYRSGPGPRWTNVDRESYARWQRHLGFTGTNADGWPGQYSWDQLRVPKS
jgi:hypothetical protein